LDALLQLVDIYDRDRSFDRTLRKVIPRAAVRLEEEYRKTPNQSIAIQLCRVYALAGNQGQKHAYWKWRTCDCRELVASLKYHSGKRWSDMSDNSLAYIFQFGREAVRDPFRNDLIRKFADVETRRRLDLCHIVYNTITSRARTATLYWIWASRTGLSIDIARKIGHMVWASRETDMHVWLGEKQGQF